jgi:hypothetical protein
MGVIAAIVLVAALAWLARIAVSPVRECRACQSRPRRNCPRCHGTGHQLRLGAQASRSAMICAARYARRRRSR